VGADTVIHDCQYVVQLLRFIPDPLTYSVADTLVRRPEITPPPGRRRRSSRPVWIYEGALSFVTEICCTYRDSTYKRERGGIIKKCPRPSRPRRPRRARACAWPTARRPAFSTAIQPSYNHHTTTIHSTKGMEPRRARACAWPTAPPCIFTLCGESLMEYTGRWQNGADARGLGCARRVGRVGRAWPGASRSLSDSPNPNARKDAYDHTCH
jgi:hypothetical protein